MVAMSNTPATEVRDDKINEIVTKLQTDFGNIFWEGKITDKKNAIRKLNRTLNEMFDKETIVVTKKIPHFYSKWQSSSGSFYIRDLDTIVLKGRISLITYLHEYAHALGMDMGNDRLSRMLRESEAQNFSQTIFKNAYPEKWANLTAMGNGAMMVAQNRVSPQPNTVPVPEAPTQPTPDSTPEPTPEPTTETTG